MKSLPYLFTAALLLSTSSLMAMDSDYWDARIRAFQNSLEKTSQELQQPRGAPREPGNLNPPVVLMRINPENPSAQWVARELGNPNPPRQGKIENELTETRILLENRLMFTKDVQEQRLLNNQLDTMRSHLYFSQRLNLSNRELEGLSLQVHQQLEEVRASMVYLQNTQAAAQQHQQAPVLPATKEKFPKLTMDTFVNEMLLGDNPLESQGWDLETTSYGLLSSQLRGKNLQEYEFIATPAYGADGKTIEDEIRYYLTHTADRTTLGSPLKFKRVAPVAQPQLALVQPGIRPAPVQPVQQYPAPVQPAQMQPGIRPAPAQPAQHYLAPAQPAQQYPAPAQQNPASNHLMSELQGRLARQITPEERAQAFQRFEQPKQVPHGEPKSFVQLRPTGQRTGAPRPLPQPAAPAIQLPPPPVVDYNLANHPQAHIQLPPPPVVDYNLANHPQAHIQLPPPVAQPPQAAPKKWVVKTPPHLKK